MASLKEPRKKSNPFLSSDVGMPYALLIIKGHSFDGRPISQMTRKQIFAYVAAHNIEAKEKNRAIRRAERKSRMRRK